MNIIQGPILSIGGFAFDSKSYYTEPERPQSIISPGGSGWMLCITCKGLGVPSILMTSLGNDVYGAILTNWANLEQIPLRNVHSESFSSTTRFSTTIFQDDHIVLTPSTKALSISETLLATNISSIKPEAIIVGYVDEKTCIRISSISKQLLGNDCLLVADCSGAFHDYSKGSLSNIFQNYNLVVMNEYEAECVIHKMGGIDKFSHFANNGTEVVITGYKKLIWFKEGTYKEFTFERFNGNDPLGAGDAIAVSLALSQGISDAKRAEAAIDTAKWICSLKYKGKISFGACSHLRI